jgi:hypothetical protein
MVASARDEGGARSAVSQAGPKLLAETVRKAGLGQAISVALAPWRKAGRCTIRARSCLTWRSR